MRAHWVTLCRPGAISSLSRSKVASERGPGIDVRIRGMDMGSPFEVVKMRSAHTRKDSRKLLALLFQPVPYAPHSFDEPRVGGIVVELGAEAADMDVDRAAIAVKVIAPDVLKQFLAGEDHAGPAGKLDQQIVFLGAERDRLPLELDLAFGRV